MKDLLTAAILLLLLLSAKGLGDDRQEAIGILEKLENHTKQTHSLVYASRRVSIDPTTKDSVSETHGMVWLVTNPADSIFGCHFRLSGHDKHGEFEYYYDGQDAYEIRRPQKLVTVFHPAQYANNEHNPAKLRTALELFVNLMIDTNVSSTLLTNLTKAAVSDQASGQKITLEYAPNEFDQKILREIYIDKDTQNIIKINTIDNWRGTIFSDTLSIQDIQRNPRLTQSDLILSGDYSTYNISEYDSEVKPRAISTVTLTGSPAPEFNYPDLSGHIMHLRDFRGRFVLLDFWESWCGWCLLAFPKLIALQNTFQGNGLVVVGVSTENPDQVKGLAHANHLTYLNILADSTIVNEYHVTNRPTYFLVDPEGIVITSSVGDLVPVKQKLEALTK